VPLIIAAAMPIFYDYCHAADATRYDASVSPLAAAAIRLRHADIFDEDSAAAAAEQRKALLPMMMALMAVKRRRMQRSARRWCARRCAERLRRNASKQREDVSLCHAAATRVAPGVTPYAMLRATYAFDALRALMPPFASGFCLREACRCLMTRRAALRASFYAAHAHMSPRLCRRDYLFCDIWRRYCAEAILALLRFMTTPRRHCFTLIDIC
jgi:hypothetical protein